MRHVALWAAYAALSFTAHSETLRSRSARALPIRPARTPSVTSTSVIRLRSRDLAPVAESSHSGGAVPSVGFGSGGIRLRSRDFLPSTVSIETGGTRPVVADEGGSSPFCGPNLIDRICSEDIVQKYGEGVREGKKAIYDQFAKEQRTLSNPAYAAAVFGAVRAQISESELKEVVGEAMGDLRRAVMRDASLSLAQRAALLSRLWVRDTRFTPAPHDAWYAQYCGPHAMGGDEGQAAAYFLNGNLHEIVFCPDTLLNAVETAKRLGGDFKTTMRDVLFDTIAHEVGHGLDVGTVPDLMGFYGRLAGCWFESHAAEIQTPLRFLAGLSSRGPIGFTEFLSSQRFRELTADQYLALAAAGRVTQSGLSRSEAFRKLQRSLGMSCRQRDEAPRTHASKEFLINALVGQNPQLLHFFGCTARSTGSTEPLSCTFAGAVRPSSVLPDESVQRRELAFAPGTGPRLAGGAAAPASLALTGLFQAPATPPSQGEPSRDDRLITTH